MAQGTDRQKGVLASLDWITIAIYLTLLVFGWISVCGASYNYGETDIFSLESRSGMQIVWIASSVCIAFVILMLDDRYYDTFAYAIYALLLILLFATIFNPHEIKGSRSWIVLGPIRLQPAEFAKFATALAISKLMTRYGFDLSKWKDFATACAVILLPMLFIIGQNETGSALVYLSFFLMLYREGMSGSFLFTGLAMVIYFVVGIRYAEPTLWDIPTSIGRFSVLLMVQVFTSAMVWVYCRNQKDALMIFGYCTGITIASLLFAEYVIPFDIVWVQLLLSAGMMGFLLYRALENRMKYYYYILSIKNYLYLNLFIIL